MQVAIIGLDGAGKTTILYRLKLNENVHTTVPTAAFNVDTVRFKNLKFLVWDTAGTADLRPLWKAYIRKADGIVFVVDSADTKRFDEAKIELDEILASRESQGVPLIILANKQDRKDAVSPIYLSHELELESLDYSVNWHLHPTAGRYGDGLHDAMIQLAKMVTENKKGSKRSRSETTNIGTASFETIEHSKFI